jgi:hypothetical protein
VISERELWAAANMVLSRHGDDAPDFIGKQITRCALSGDAEGVRVWKAIADRLDRLSVELQRHRSNSVH